MSWFSTPRRQCGVRVGITTQSRPGAGRRLPVLVLDPATTAGRRLVTENVRDFAAPQLGARLVRLHIVRLAKRSWYCQCSPR